MFTACPANCNGGTCDAVTGDCGFIEGCKAGFYGSRCSSSKRSSYVICGH